MSYATRWETAPGRRADPEGDSLPAELLELSERVRALPREVRAGLEPLVADALEQARFRGRVVHLASDALQTLRLELEMLRFDLDTTRRERDELRRLLEDWDAGEDA